MTDVIRVALCDDHAVVRSGLRRIVAEEPGLEVVGEAGTADEAIAVARAARPDVFVMDLGLPGASGIDATRRIAEVSPQTKILVLTVHDDVAYLRKAFDAGARGYLVKDAADVELVLAIRQVASGEEYVHPRLGAALLTPAAAGCVGGPAASCPSASSRCSAAWLWASPTPRSPPSCTCRCAPSRRTGPTSSRSSGSRPAPTWSATPATRSPRGRGGAGSVAARSTDP